MWNLALVTTFLFFRIIHKAILFEKVIILTKVIPKIFFIYITNAWSNKIYTIIQIKKMFLIISGNTQAV